MKDKSYYLSDKLYKTNYIRWTGLKCTLLQYFSCLETLIFQVIFISIIQCQFIRNEAFTAIFEMKILFTNIFGMAVRMQSWVGLQTESYNSIFYGISLISVDVGIRRGTLVSLLNRKAINTILNVKVFLHIF